MMWKSAIIFCIAQFAGLLNTQEMCAITCPRNLTGHCIDGNVPNPRSCLSFCQCSNCLPFFQDCPIDLVYRPDDDRCVRREDYPTCYATPEISTVAPPTKTATCAANRYEYLGEANPLPFDEVLADVDNRYNISDDSLLIPANGYYFVSISGATNVGTGLDMGLMVDGTKLINLYRVDPLTFGADTNSRDFLGWFLQGTKLQISSESFRLYSNLGRLTSWSTFSVTEAMDFDHLFSVSRSSNYSREIPLRFDTVHGNIGGGWDQNSGQFVAIYNGTYYFSISTGVHPFQHAHIDFRVNGQVLTVVHQHGQTSGGVSTTARAVLLNLVQGDIVQMEAPMAAGGYSDQYRQTAFSGFLYNPSHGPPLAWSAYNESRYYVVAREDPLHFETILVNEGNVYNTDTHIVTCTTGGYYFVQLSLGTVEGRPAVMELMSNNGTVLHLTREDTDIPAGGDTLSRSAIIRCDQGHTLRIAAQECAFESTDHITSFLGFFLYPL